MFDITLYNFAKKHNSTKTPEVGRGSVYSGTLKEDSGILSPSIYFRFASGFAPFEMNYAFISNFSRYYYIREWTFEQGRWLADMEVDALASWKTLIGESTQYVLRSETDYDPRIPDYLYSTFSGVAMSATSVNNPWFTSLKDGYFILGIVSGSPLAQGGTTWYALDFGNFNLLRSRLFSDVNWLDITDISANLQKALINPIQYISSIFWVPYTPLTYTAEVIGGFKVGYWFIDGVNAKVMDPSLLTVKDFEIDIPKHPQNESLGSWTSASNYSRYTLYFPPFGSIELPADQLVNSNKLYVRLLLDCVGQTSVLIASPFSGYTSIIAQSYAKVGIEQQLGQTASDVVRVITGTVGGALAVGTSAASGNAAGVVGGLSGIATGLTAMTPSLQTAGAGGGSMAELRTPVELRARFKVVCDEFKEHFGRPYCRPSKINLLPGYVLCKDAELELPCTTNEMDDIVSALNGGFYYE